MSKTISTTELACLIREYPDHKFLHINTNTFRKIEKAGKKCIYLNLQFVNPKDGKKIRAAFDAPMAVFSGSAAYAKDADPEKAKHMSSSIQKLTIEDLQGTKFAEKSPDEETRNELLKVLTDGTEDLITVLDRLDLEFEEFFKSVEAGTVKLKFSINNFKRYSHKQASRAKGEGEDIPEEELIGGKVKLDNPMYRIRLPLAEEDGVKYLGKKWIPKGMTQDDPKARKIQITPLVSRMTNGQSYLIPNKINPKTKKPEVINGATSHNMTNLEAPNYITRYTIFSGIVTCDTINISTFGIALEVGFNSLAIKSHPRNSASTAISKETEAKRDRMKAAGMFGDDEDEPEEEAPENNSEDDGGDDDDEDAPIDKEEEEDELPKPQPKKTGAKYKKLEESEEDDTPPPPPKKAVIVAKKAAKSKKPVEPEPEDDDEDDTPPPPPTKKATVTAAKKTAAKPKKLAEPEPEEDDEEDDEDTPPPPPPKKVAVAAKKPAATATKPKKLVEPEEEEDDDEDDTPPQPPPPKKATAAKKSTPAAKPKKVAAEPEETPDSD